VELAKAERDFGAECDVVAGARVSVREVQVLTPYESHQPKQALDGLGVEPLAGSRFDEAPDGVFETDGLLENQQCVEGDSAFSKVHGRLAGGAPGGHLGQAILPPQRLRLCGSGKFSRRKPKNIQRARTADHEQAYSRCGLRHTARAAARFPEYSRAVDAQWRTAVPPCPMNTHTPTVGILPAVRSLSAEP
jgi:hypothetical protein